MTRKKILWLCSWYPNKLEPFNGDFIQRHAHAAALYNDIFVVHVAGDNISQKELSVINKSAGLTELVIYYKQNLSFLRKFINYYRWRSAYKKAIQQYIEENGKPDLVHIHVPIKAGLLGIWMKKKFAIPYLVTEHWTIYQPQNKVKYQQQNPVFRSMLQLIMQHSKLLLPVSKNLGELMNKLVAKKDFTVVANVANEKYFYYTDTNKSTAPFQFIHVSNMNYQKNAEAIIKCFASFQTKFPATELVMVGSVSTAIKELIEQTGLADKKIFLKGEISYTDVATAMQEANALVLFSRYENSPCSIIEALCCGLPVIATNVGGIAEVITEGVNGYLVESEDEAALMLAFENMIQNYAAFDRKKIAELATSKFSYPVIGQQLDDIYRSVLLTNS